MAAPVSGSLLFFFYLSLFVMFAAEGDICVVTAEHKLLSSPDDLSVFDAGVELCSLPAPADGGDFLNHIGKFQEPSRALKQMPGKVCPQAVTQDRGVLSSALT